MNDTPFICDGLEVELGGRAVLAGLTLAVPRGAVYALLGRNGAGKTTAIRCLLGQWRPRRGQALLFGADAWRTRATAMLRIGVVPEEPDIPPTLTSADLARFAAPLYPRWDGARFIERLRDLAIPTDAPFARLSRGQKTQVQLTLALAGRPEALVLDDPTLGLDAIARREVLAELVRELADHGTTMLLATNDVSAADGLATHVGILRDGKLVLDGVVEDLERGPLEEVLRQVAA